MRKTQLLLETLEALPVDRSVARLGGELLRSYRRRENPREWVDAVIAATALRHHLSLVTYNRKDYPYPDLRLYPLR